MLNIRRSPRPARQARALLAPSLPTLDPSLLLPTLSPSRPPQYPLDRLGSPGARLFCLVGAGVYHAVRHFADGGLVLMPAYHHPFEVEVVRAAGAQVVFYRVDDEMRVDVEDVEQKMRTQPVRLVYLIHYVGIAQPAQAIADLCRRRGAALFEDCSQSLFSHHPDGSPIGSVGDAAAFCLYNSLPVPHGGLLLGTLPTPDRISPPLVATLRYMAGLTFTHLQIRNDSVFVRLLQRFARAAAREAAVARPRARIPISDHLVERDLALGASPLTERLLRRFDAELVVRRRRRNFHRLAEALSGRLPVIGHPLPQGTCPLFLPVRVADKSRAVEQLKQRGIEAINFWSVGDPACRIDEFPEVAVLRREVMELPCHQSLDDEAIDEIARAAKSLRTS